MMLWSAKSKHPGLTNGEIFSTYFIYPVIKIPKVTDERTDRRTKRRLAITIVRTLPTICSHIGLVIK